MVALDDAILGVGLVWLEHVVVMTFPLVHPGCLISGTSLLALVSSSERLGVVFLLLDTSISLISELFIFQGRRSK